MRRNYSSILNFYQKLLKKEGLNLKGLGWNSKKKNQIRLKNLYEIITYYKKKNFSILDFGCGLSNLYIFLKKKKLKFIYEGLDVSRDIIKYSSLKFKNNRYHQIDILKDKSFKKKFDVIVLNGIFTIKDKLTDKQMYEYIFKIFNRLKKNCKGVIIVNFLTSSPDWKNNANFYPSMEKIFRFINTKISKEYSYFHCSDLFEGFLVIRLKK